MARTWWGITGWLLALVLGAATARAEDALESYAVLIGSNTGGQGQRRLAHAETDAERMAELFGELGRVARDHITLLRQPTPREVEDALATLQKQLARRHAEGKKTQVLFYYSGHARAQGLSLGQEELPLVALRSALSALPSTLTVVVLDACQSGAFSGVKGAAPAADFSLSSVHDLHSRGIAVLASSTGSELSQESPELTGSYFTHHLTVALRGPGDVDGNGRVSLDEAYRYAYDRTLSDTARTQIGMQHATLETNLTGRGDIALTYPSDADAVLVLPSELTGRVLVQRAGRGVVLAELVKARGSALALALPAARYDVLVRDEQRPTHARECSIGLPHKQPMELSLALCREVELPDPEAKGEHAAPPPYEVWFAELGITGSAQRSDGYTDRLEQFRYQNSTRVGWFRGLVSDDQKVFLDGAIGRAVRPNLSLLVRFDTFEARSFDRLLSGPNWKGRTDSFDWRTQAVSLGARGRLRLWREYVVAVAEASLGLAISRSTYEREGDAPKDWSFGPALRGALGFTFAFNDHFGVYLLGGYAVVRSLRNEIGDHHEDGDFFGSFGLRIRSLKGWW